MKKITTGQVLEAKERENQEKEAMQVNQKKLYSKETCHFFRVLRLSGRKHPDLFLDQAMDSLLFDGFPAFTFYNIQRILTTCKANIQRLAPKDCNVHNKETRKERRSKGG